MNRARAVLDGFLTELADVRAAAGRPSLRRLEELTAEHEHPLRRSTINDKLNAESVPDWEFVDAFLFGCEQHAPTLDLAHTNRAVWNHRHSQVLELIERLHEETHFAEAARAELHRQLTPRQLPPRARQFSGRVAELAVLDGLLDSDDDNTPIAVIHGTAGVGKTTLAVRWAHRVADRFPDGQLYVNLRGYDPSGSPLTVAQAIRGFLDALRVPPERVPTSLDSQVALYRSLLADRRVLILLDNAANVEQVRPLLPGSPLCAVLVTGRTPLTGLTAVEGAEALLVQRFSPEEANQLVARQVRDRRPAAEPAAVTEIVELCARLPLAVSIAAARAAGCPHLRLDELAAQLRDARARLDALEGGDPTSSARAVFSWSYLQLGSAAARLFRLLALHPGPEISASAAASLAAVDPGELRQTITQLAELQLVEELSPGRYSFHDLLRVYSTELGETTDSSTDRAAALHRGLDHYLRSADAASTAWDPHRDPLRLIEPAPGTTPERFANPGLALVWLTQEYPVLLQVIRQAAAAGATAHTWQLAWSLVDFFNRQGHWDDWEAVLRLALEAAEQVDDRPGQARTFRGLGRALAVLGREEEGRDHLRRALELFTELGDRAGQGHVQVDIAVSLDRADEPVTALKHAEQALTAYRAAGSRVGEANAMNCIGWLQARLGYYQRSLDYCLTALDLLRELNDPAGQAATLDSLGYASQRLGRHQEATQHYRQALTLFEQVGDPYMQADTLDHLSTNLLDAGQTDEARATWEQAAVLFDQVGALDRAEDLRTRLGGPDP